MATPSVNVGGNGGIQTAKPRRSSGSKAGQSRSYPRGVGVDFRKVAGLTLLNYIDHQGKVEHLDLYL